MPSTRGVGLQLSEFGICIEETVKDASTGTAILKKHYIVHPITTKIYPSSLFAILGGSGSGKTTLLNAIAGRYDKNSYSIEGSLFFEKDNCSVGYVSQADYLLPHLTVKETLLFTAKLKIAKHQLAQVSRQELSREYTHDDIVDEVILDLGLKECTNSRIGNDAEAGGKRGISGGEKRRVSVALQILTNPEVLCADEPTSGLDSFTAITLMETLQRLTTSARRTTVISSIHQPRADVFALFTNVLILSKGGHAIYCGSTKHMMDYFQQIGYECPKDANPADFYVDLSSVDFEDGDKKVESIRRVQQLIQHFQGNHDQQRQTSMRSESLGSASDHDDSRLSLLVPESNKPHVLPFHQQMFLLLRRFVLNNYRDGWNFIAGIIQALLIGLVIMSIFWQLDDSYEGVQSRCGLIYISISVEHYIMALILIERYYHEIKVFDRELLDNLYNPTAYFLAHFVSMIPQILLQEIVHGIPIYFGSGLRPGVDNFFMFFGVSVVVGLCINGLVWMSLSLIRSFPEASLLTNVNYTFITICAGFLVNYNTMPIYVFWVRYISFLSYAYRIIMTTEFTHREIGSGCNHDDYLSAYNCINGKDVLSNYGIVQNDYQNTWPALISIALIYHLVAVVALNFLRHPPIGAVVTEILVVKAEENDLLQLQTPRNDQEEEINPLNNDIDDEVGGGNKSTGTRSSRAAAQGREIRITVKKINLFVPVQHTVPVVQSTTNESTKPLPQSGNNVKKILNNINCEIQPGRLVAIMGGSGSGKTTLLNLLANRIPHHCLKTNPGDSASFFSVQNAYHGSGSILFNGKQPSSAEIRSAIGYVQQFDYHLPSLTVFETLTFQAQIRLPLNTATSERERRVLEVIKTLGLQQCAKIRVGSEDVKGISGGEKRRLSIGVQLLSDPTICLFDEPTTGLDTFTARHIVLTLKTLATDYELATSKKTVILSIHQPRYDIFACIDDVILLSRGELIWSGPVPQMLQHFESIGYPCPAFSNPADFILDLSSIDFRTTEREQSTRDTLVTLVLSFQSRTDFPKVEMVETTLPRLTDPAVERDTDEDHLTVMKSSLLSETTTTVPNNNDNSNTPDKNNDTEKRSWESMIKPDYYTFPILLARAWVNISRQPDLLFNRVSQSVFFGLILCCFFAPIGDDQNSIQNRVGILQELTALCFIGMLSCIAIYPSERNVFYREYVDGYYTARSFVMTYFAIAIPILVVSAFGVALLMVYAIGINPGDQSAWIAFTYVLFCFMFTGESLGIMFCSAFQHVGFSLNIVSAVITIFTNTAGFFSLSMPLFIILISYISPISWGSYILSNITFEDETFSCSDDEQTNGSCLATGDAVLDFYDFNHGHLSLHYIIIGIVTTGYWLLALIAVRVSAYRLSH